MSLWSRLLGTNDIVDTVSNAADALHYSKEEKATHFERMLSLYEPFKIAQRLLALVLTIPYVVIFMISAVLFVVSIAFDPCVADVGCIDKGLRIKTTASELAQWNNEVLGFKVALVLGFYFGGGALEGVAGRIARGKNE